MFVKRVVVNNFLSYDHADVTFGEALNIITGANASGKTNLIDSIYFASVGRSSRHSRDKELIKWETNNGSRVTLLVQKKFSKHTIDIYMDPQGKKRITVDNIPLQRMGELMGVLNVVFFSPTEMKLVKDAPADRRRFLDISLCQQSKTYFYTLQRYNSLLAQRNKILKDYRGRPTLRDMLNVVDADFIRCATFIIQERKKYVDAITPYAQREHYKLTGGKEELKLQYETEAVDFNNIAGSLQKLLSEAFTADARLEYSTVGPHRDDIKITSGDVDVRRFGSQGQQRSAVLSLKLAEIASFKARTGETPVLLLDDVLSELDADRQKALFEAVKGMQTIITCTETDQTKDNATIFEIKERQVKRID